MALDRAGNLYIAEWNNNRIRKVNSAGVISTVAGTGTAGFSGDGGAATSAQLSNPQDVALDAAGNLYIAEWNNNRIRKVNSAGVISTVAGTGTAGFSGDGGAATSAQLSNPQDVALDAAGNLYIADVNNNRIRKVDSSGNISTVAGGGSSLGDGGAATAAQLGAPRSVALDGAGNLYIADWSDHRIRKVDSSGNISTVAGTGTQGFSGDGAAATAAQLNSPWDVAVDGSGNLYIADRNNNRIRKVNSAGNISTVAGTGTAGFSGDGAAAVAAQLQSPQGVALDGAGNLYIADAGNHRIRKVDSSGNISTVAGNGTASFGGDSGAATAAQLSDPSGGVALDGAGNLYIVDRGNDRIRKVDSAGVISTVAGRERLSNPQDVALDGSGNLYIADMGNHRIHKVNSAGVISTVAGSGTAGFSGDGGAATAAQLNQPRGVAPDGAGNLYIADSNNQRIRKVDSDGNISTVAGDGMIGSGGDGGPATAARLGYPLGVAVDGAGNLYIAESGSNRVRKVDTAGVISTVAGDGTYGFGGDGGPATAAQLQDPYDVVLDGAGNLYIADLSDHRIRKVDSDGNISTVAGDGTSGFSGDGGAAMAAQLSSPSGVALDGAGNLYIGDQDNNRIRKIATVPGFSAGILSTGVITTVAGDGAQGYGGDGGAAVAAQLNQPIGVALDGAGNLYIADGGNNRIRKVGPPPPPPARPREPEPTVEPVGVFELSFTPAAEADPSEPMSQTLMLRAVGGAAEFEVLTSARWIEVSRWSGSASWKGSLAAGETITLRVTVNPLGLRPGTHRGYVYIRSGGRASRVRIVLEVAPPTGPDVTESGGVLNAARMSAYGEAGLFGPPALPLTPGSLVVVQGVNFLAGERLAAADFPLPTSLGGVRVLFDGLEAPLFAVGPQRIEAQLPSALGGESLAAGGLAVAEVVVEAGGKSSYPRRFWVGPHGPGVFTASGAGSGQAIALFAGTTALAAPSGFGAGSRPARAGEVLEIYATGLGPVSPPLADGMNSCAPAGVCLADGSNVVLRHTTERPRVSIGGVAVAADGVLFSGSAPTLAAVDMVLVEVPAGIEPSAAAEVLIAIGGRESQPGVTVAVE